MCRDATVAKRAIALVNAGESTDTEANALFLTAYSASWGTLASVSSRNAFMSAWLGNELTDPASYLTAEYIAFHASEFQLGAGFLISPNAVSVAEDGSVIFIDDPKRPTDVVVVPLQTLMINIQRADVSRVGTEAALTSVLGKLPEPVDGQMILIAVTAPVLATLNLRPPSGTEQGLGPLWHPGGIMFDGTPQAAIDFPSSVSGVSAHPVVLTAPKAQWAAMAQSYVIAVASYDSATTGAAHAAAAAAAGNAAVRSLY